MNQKGNDTESENPTPWNRWFRQANADDPGAAHSIIVAAQPLIQHLCNVPLFRNQLGKDEVYSIAYYALVTFINKKKNLIMSIICTSKMTTTYLQMKRL